MKAAISIFLCLWLRTAGIAQSAPDFTFTDIHGTQHTLSASLAAGKTVIIDFFKIDCEPCMYWVSATNDVYSKWGSGNADVELWAFSGEDENADLENFATDSAVAFTLCGIEGGAGTVIDMYAADYEFTGYPTYAVICPDGGIVWDIWPLTAGTPEIDEKVAVCGATGVVTSADSPDQEILIGCIWPNPTAGNLHLSLDEKVNANEQIKVSVYSMSGNTVFTVDQAGDRDEVDLELSDLRPGMYFLIVTSSGGLLEKEKFVKL